MCADEKRANPARTGVLSDRRERRTSLLAATALRSRWEMPASPHRCLPASVTPRLRSPRISHDFLLVLPETVNRVETHLSHRKQTIGHLSTRDVPAHSYFRNFFAPPGELLRRTNFKSCRAEVPPSFVGASERYVQSFGTQAPRMRRLGLWYGRQ